MKQVKFDYVDQKDGFTIYSKCLQRSVEARWKLKNVDEWKRLVPETEKVFDFLIEEGDKRGFDVGDILEITNLSGDSCFSIASKLENKKIMESIIRRGTKLNSIYYNMVVPDFEYPDLAITMMQKGINPNVICYDGHSSFDRRPSSFKSEEARKLLARFTFSSRSIYFSFEDINCCCSSALKKFYYENGEFVKMTNENRIGQGGFGSVFRGTFHGETKAMKCVLIERIEGDHEMLKDAESEQEKHMSEFWIQKKSGGPGILIPEAIIRQQNQEPDNKGKWIAKNYNIYVYPLYKLNLYEFHNQYDELFTNDIMKDILQKCLTRKCST